MPLHHHWSFALLGAVTASLATGCVPDSPAPVLPTEWSGLRVVRNGELGGSTPVWTVDAEPALVIGRADGAGEPEEAFTAITTVDVNERGDILVTDPRNSAVRLFDSTGTHIRSWGRRGQGPGEFTSLTAAYFRGADTILAVESTAGTLRVHQLLAGAEFVSTRSWTGDRWSSSLLAGERVRSIRLLDGDAVLLTLALEASTGAQPATEVVRDSSRFIWSDVEATTSMRLGSWQGNMRMILRTPSDTGAPSAPSFNIPFTPMTFASGDPGGRIICVGDSARPLVLCAHRDGTAVVFSWQATPVALPDSLLSRFQQSTTQLLTTMRGFSTAQARALLESVGLPQTQPLFQPIKVAADGWIWVPVSRAEPAPAGYDLYAVFSADGRYDGDAAIPAGLVVRKIYGDRIFAVRTSESGVPQLVRLTLHRS